MTKDRKEPDSADKLVSSISLGIITRSTILTTIVTMIVVGGMIILESIGN